MMKRTLSYAPPYQRWHYYTTGPALAEDQMSMAGNSGTAYSS